jgi:hypothetical protein
MNGRLLTAALACAFLPGLALAPALAAPGAAGPSLEVSVIHAMHSDGGVSIDPQLRDLPQLTRDQPFVRYNVYRLLDRKQFHLEEGKPVGENLANGRSLQVVLEGVAAAANEKRYQLQTQIGEPGKKAFLRSLEVTASANQPFFVAGQSYQGGTLFLELVIRP